MSDLPHTLYRPVHDGNGDRRSGRNGRRKSITTSDVDEAVRLNAELRDRRKSMRQREQGYTVEEIFNGEADKD